jgi:hypothetical protein
MHRRLHAICLLGLASVTAAVHGGEAVRYRDAHGVEIIGGRSTSVPAPSAASAALAAVAAQRTTPARWQVEPHEQQARDLDRVAILRQELVAEQAAIDFHLRHSLGLDTEAELRALDQLRRHQQNIIALQAEIKRTAMLKK